MVYNRTSQLKFIKIIKYNTILFYIWHIYLSGTIVNRGGVGQEWECHVGTIPAINQMLGRTPLSCKPCRTIADPSGSGHYLAESSISGLRTTGHPTSQGTAAGFDPQSIELFWGESWRGSPKDLKGQYRNLEADPVLHCSFLSSEIYVLCTESL